MITIKIGVKPEALDAAVEAVKQYAAVKEYRVTVDLEERVVGVTEVPGAPVDVAAKQAELLDVVVQAAGAGAVVFVSGKAW